MAKNTLMTSPGAHLPWSTAQQIRKQAIALVRSVEKLQVPPPLTTAAVEDLAPDKELYQERSVAVTLLEDLSTDEGQQVAAALGINLDDFRRDLSLQQSAWRAVRTCQSIVRGVKNAARVRERVRQVATAIALQDVEELLQDPAALTPEQRRTLQALRDDVLRLQAQQAAPQQESRQKGKKQREAQAVRVQGVERRRQALQVLAALARGERPVQRELVDAAAVLDQLAAEEEEDPVPSPEPRERPR